MGATVCLSMDVTKIRNGLTDWTGNRPEIELIFCIILDPTMLSMFSAPVSFVSTDIHVPGPHLNVRRY